MKVKIEKQSDGSYIAYNVGDKQVSLIGTGETVTSAKEDFFNSVEEAIETYTEMELNVPECLLTEVQFKFDLSSLFEYYDVLNVSAFARYVGINPTLMRQYKQGKTYISETQLQKIEDSIHAIGKQFTELQLV